MTSLSFPDVNVWLALASHEHVHSAIARRWWNAQDGPIAFCRIAQLGLLRLLATAAVMGNRPLTVDQSWRIHDGLCADDRVIFVYERPEVEHFFRARATGRAPSPKLWADAWMLAIAETAGGKLITFDKALAMRGAECLLAG